jgi:hypothetical protein
MFGAVAGSLQPCISRCLMNLSFLTDIKRKEKEDLYYFNLKKYLEIFLLSKYQFFLINDGIFRAFRTHIFQI